MGKRLLKDKEMIIDIIKTTLIPLIVWFSLIAAVMAIASFFNRDRDEYVAKCIEAMELPDPGVRCKARWELRDAN